MSNNIVISKGVNTASGDYFNAVYPTINKAVFTMGEHQESRNGATRELEAFKTTVHNPLNRCVGGFNRDINVFFLLAEALWIMVGRRDVALLDVFNSGMKQYSDDGVNFHAPYGWRLRKHGWHSIHTEKNENIVPKDQVAIAVKNLKKNPDCRRVALQIWNADFDLDTQSKDLPCNDFVFLKVRRGKLNISIANRSNDLHWGLCTNIFQFSMLQELLASAMGFGVGKQTHVSDSLHIYLDNQITQKLINNNENHYNDIYRFCKSAPMEFNWKDEDPALRIYEFDYHVGYMLDFVEDLANNGAANIPYPALVELLEFSPSLYEFFQLFDVYIEYKKRLSSINGGLAKNDKTALRLNTIGRLMDMNNKNRFIHQDYYFLALNFFASKVNSEELKAAFGDSLNPQIGLL